MYITQCGLRSYGLDSRKLHEFFLIEASFLVYYCDRPENTNLQFDKHRNYGSLAARCQWGIRNALFFVARDNEDADSAAGAAQRLRRDAPALPQPSPILGVSCWLPPRPASQPETWSEWYYSWELWLRQLINNVRHLGRGGLKTHRYWIWKARQHEAQTAIWNDPRGYYFCNIVAVRPEAQGRGVGRKLFQVVTEERADREGVKCYLESSKGAPNVQIYERLGFKTAKEMECKDGEDTCMVSLTLF